MAYSEVVSSTVAPAYDPKDTSPATFVHVLRDELGCINASRQKRDVKPKALAGNLTGLAFSGGGIRSATFNLGILQALAENGLLHQFDYLSTVSGGGYIGSWLAALTQRLTKEFAAKFEEVEKVLSPCKYEPDKRPEPSVLHWLRLYSNYLTPHTGAISGDTWAMLGTWLRNVLLNQTIFALIFMSLFVLCQSVLLPLILVEDDGLAYLVSGGILLFVASVSMAVNVMGEAPTTAIRQTLFRRVKVTVTVMLPFVAACVLLNSGLWHTSYGEEPLWTWAMAGAAFYFVAWGVVACMAVVRRWWRERQSKPRKLMVSILALVVFSPMAGAVGGCLLRGYVLSLNHLPDWANGSDSEVALVFGSGALMMVVLLTGTLHIGLVGRGSVDVVREWWARLGGYLTLITIGWLLLAGACAFGPLAVRWTLFELRHWSMAAGLLWVLHNFLGLKAASSARTSGEVSSVAKAKKDGSENPCEDGEKKKSRIMATLTSPRVLNILAKLAPYVFIVGLVLLLATTVQIAAGLVFSPDYTRELWRFNNGMDWTDLAGDYWVVFEKGSAAWLALSAVALFLAGVGMSWRVDVNDFSLHHFYRNRLVRCYLGASNSDRKPEPFTGFDPNDDVALSELCDNYPGPYPILNAALNITGGEELGYATRRAKSFMFTPLYCGYELSSGDGPKRFTCDDGYLPTYSKTVQGRSVAGVGKFGSEGGISLGTAMAISGAAASPNMGYFTTPATAFYMALFDVRLGWWMGNSRYPKKWQSLGPALGLGYLLSEVLGQSDQQKGYVYLSDGGHFENLAVYELIRRHCRVIVACDGDCDLQFQFENLLSLIEKARTDFGARIEINYETIRPSDGARESEVNHVVGTIYYDPKNPKDTGKLIFVKASLPKKPEAGMKPRDSEQRTLPDDVWQYAKLHPTFPHQTTADQWFDELQFESYRALGEFIGVHAAEDIGDALRSVVG